MSKLIKKILKFCGELKEEKNENTDIMKDDNGEKVTVGLPAPLTPETVIKNGWEGKYMIVRGKVFNKPE